MLNARYKVEFDNGASDYRMVVIRITTGLTHRCAYVSVPSDHPFHGKGYSHEIEFDCSAKTINLTDPIGTLITAYKAEKDPTKMAISYACDVHGGITYANGKDGYPVEGDHWWFGFDAAHTGDNFDGGRPLEYMIAECEKLKCFLQSHETVAKSK